MRAIFLAIVFCVVGCKPAEKAAPPPFLMEADAGEAPPAEDEGNADELFQRAMGLRNDHPGESIRLYKKAAERGDPALQARVKEQLAQFEPVMRDRAREAYLFGFELRNTSPNDAARNFEQAMDLSPRGDPIHEKAKEQLARLKKTTKKP